MSASLATQMDTVPEGERVKITRKGQGMETKYSVKQLTGSPKEIAVDSTDWGSDEN